MYFKIAPAIVILLLSFFTYGQVRITEIEASNTNDYLDFASESYSDWIELYNYTDTVVDLSNHYLSDKLELKTKWMIPSGTSIQPKSYILFFADDKDFGNHTNFSLSSDGESVGLFNSMGDTIDAINYPEQIVDISYGRSNTDINSWGYFFESTPGKPNTTELSYNSKIVGAPTFSKKGGVFTSAVNVSINSTLNGTIRYTLDGSEPTLNSPEFTTELNLSSTTIVRARVFQAGNLPGVIASQSYFINENISLPIISISTNPENLFDDTTGIYVSGVYAVEGDFTSPNYYNDWKKPVNFEYFSKDGNQLLNIQLEYELTGELRNYGLKSFRLNAKGKYGTDYIENVFFDNRLYQGSQSIIVRNGGWPDLSYSLLRDGLIQTLSGRNTDLDYQEYQPCVVFYNGQYYGIQNIREKIDEEFLKNNSGASDNINLLENHSADVIEGTNSDFLLLKDYIITKDLSKDSIFKFVEDNLDINAFINYQIIQSYSANTDWPIKNIKFWKDNVANSKWRWIIFDTDFGFGLEGKVDHNSIRYIADSTYLESHNPLYSTEIFRKMLKNESFKEKFVSKYFTLLDTYYSYEFVLNRINEMSMEIDADVTRHATLWSHVNSYNGWKSQIDVLRDFAKRRPDYLRQYLKDFFELNDCKKLTINQRTDGGYFLVNGVKVTDKVFVLNSPTNISCEIVAVPAAGYRFNGWENIGSVSSNSIDIALLEDSTVSFYFEPTAETILDSTIKTNTKLTLENSPYLITKDIIINPNVTLTVEPGVTILMSDRANIFVYGSVHLNGTENSPIELTPNYKSGYNKWGSFVFVNATDSSSFSYVTITGASNAHNLTRDKAAISSFGSILSIDHCTIVDVYKDPIFAQESKVYLTNSVIHSKVTGDLINIKRGYGYIDGCEFIGNNQVDTDAIDYDGITGGVIKNSIIHSFFGGNSDGIDLGENSKNILVENMLIYDCTDKGVSIGQASTAILKNNVIYACDMGVGIKDLNSYANIDKNTFYGNFYGVATFEKNLGSGGGTADISNCIISLSSQDLFMDQFSNINSTYTLFFDSLYTGEGNKKGNPLFKNTNLGNFELSPTSIAINAGDPLHAKDQDNSITDMGAIFTFNGPTKIEGVFINELVSSNDNGLKDENGKFEDWIELYNSNDYAIDIAGLYVSDILLNPTLWKIPELKPKATRIPAKGFLILWADGDTLEGPNHIGLKLNAVGEHITLTKIEGNDTTIIDQVVFPTMPANSSFSRYGDGSENWIITTKTTPWMTNNLNLPYFTSTPSAFASIGYNLDYTITAQDLDEDQLKLSIDNLPSWLTFIDNEDGTGSLRGFPQIEEEGVYNLVFKLEDGINTKIVFQEFTLYVNEGLMTNNELPLTATNYATAFPNPISNTFEVAINQSYDPLETNINIYNQLGEKIDAHNDTNCNRFIFNSSQWSNGIYFIEISTKGNLKERLKVVKIE